jgi:hypothetical protein
MMVGFVQGGGCGEAKGTWPDFSSNANAIAAASQ